MNIYISSYVALKKVMLLRLMHQVGAIHELPLRKIKAFTAFLRKSWLYRFFKT